MTQSNLRKIVSSVSAAAFLAGGSLFAGDYGKVVIDDKAPVEAWHYCDIFDSTTFYKSDTGFVRKVKLIGRWQGQWISQTEEITNPISGLVERGGFHQHQTRRFRVGLDLGLAHNLSFKANFNLSDSSGANRELFVDETFNNIDEMVLEWEPDHYDDPKAPVKNFRLNYIAIGKQKQKITREFSTSSKKILTIERSQIVNEVVSNKPWGVTIGFEFAGIEQEIGGWLYGAEDVHPANVGARNRLGFPDTDSRGGFTYRAEIPVTDVTTFFFDYQFTNTSGGLVSARGNADTSYGSNYEHVLAFGTENDLGRLQIITDIIIGLNRRAQNGAIGGTTLDNIPVGNDTWGFVFLPTYEITEKLEAVFKYAYMDEGRQQRTQRYAGQRHTLQNYHTFYAGLNYYICDHKFKVMAGYEYATGDLYGFGGSDITSNSWMLGIRGYF